MGDEALLHVAGLCTVFAEVDPNQKERIILALHRADVGISVDTAVDVAKDAADFVLLHKDLAILASVFLPFLPLLASQILLNNFLSDIPATAIASDRVDE